LSIIFKIGRATFTIFSFIWFLGVWSECRDLKDAILEYRKAKSYGLSVGGFEKYADLAKEKIKRSKEDFYLNLIIFAVLLFLAIVCWKLAE
jgi:hypothetical protein